MEARKVELRWRTWWRHAEASLGHPLDCGGEVVGLSVEDASEILANGDSHLSYVEAVRANESYHSFATRFSGGSGGLREAVAAWENEGGATSRDLLAGMWVAPRLRAETSQATPLVAFLNDVGVPRIEIGVREFECIGASPPHDHPHIYLQMGGNDELICPYCATRFVFNATLSSRETRPENCCHERLS